MDNFTSSVGKIKIDTFSNSSLNSAQNVFKKDFYSKANKQNIDTYEDIDYSIDIDLQEQVELHADDKEWYEVALATACVGVTSVVSGVLKLVEYADDGVTWVQGTVVSGIARLFGADELAEKIENWTMDEIAKDKVGEINKFFYENTEIGRNINEASAMKYDSELAKGIQNVTSEVVLIAGATAATVVTGGAAAPLFAVGFAVGAGQSAEKKFQDKENRDFWKDSLEIGVDGTIKGLSTMAVGKAGASAVNGVKSIANGTLKTTVKESLKAFNKTAIKSTIKNSGRKIVKNTALQTLKDKDTWLETGAMVADDVKTGIQTGEWNITRMIGDATLIYGENYIGNLAGGILSDSVGKIDRITELYEQGQDAAIDKYNVGFKTYREHAEKHVYYVADYVQDLSKNVDGINVDETLFGSLVHDLGMKGGYVEYNGVYRKADDVLDELRKAGKEVSFGDINSYVRKPHPLNSALTALTDDVIPDGVDRDVVALLAMSHSKSTSGISYFDNPKQWNECVDKLENALKQFNSDNGTVFEFDSEKLRKMIADPDEFTRLQKQALIIRDGDAMSKVATNNGNTIMQTRNVSVVKNNNPRMSFNDVVVDEDIEVAGLSDIIETADGKFVGDASAGVKFHAGELNTKFSSKTDGTSYYRASVDLVEPNQTPNSTLFAIKERIGEVNTYSNCGTREFTLNLPKEAEGTELGNWYKKEIEKNLRNELTMKIGDQLSKGLIDQNTYNKQLNFYNNMKVKFG